MADIIMLISIIWYVAPVLVILVLLDLPFWIVRR